MKDVALRSFTITATDDMGDGPVILALARVPAGRSSGVYTPAKAWPGIVTVYDVSSVPLAASKYRIVKLPERPPVFMIPSPVLQPSLPAFSTRGAFTTRSFAADTLYDVNCWPPPAVAGGGATSLTTATIATLAVIVAEYPVALGGGPTVPSP